MNFFSSEISRCTYFNDCDDYDKLLFINPFVLSKMMKRTYIPTPLNNEYITTLGYYYGLGIR